MKKLFGKTLRVLRNILIALIIITPFFIHVCPTFGGGASADDRLNYQKRAKKYYINCKFKNENRKHFSLKTKYTDPYADRTTGKNSVPKDKLPVEVSSFLDNPSMDDFTVTWYGHSTLIIQMSGLNIAIDPVFSKMASPVPFVGCHRYSPIEERIEDLPDIDICLISHDHYDHLDYSTIKKIDSKVKLYLVPLGVENHLQNWGIDKEKISNLAWWKSKKKDGLTIVCTPARHFSGRRIIDSNDSLWCSWVLMNDKLKVFESGDTGYGSHFKRIREKYGDFDFCMMDCAQYSGSWHDVHMFPEEAVQAAMDMGTTKIMPIHWGAFKLSDHSWDDPAERMVTEGEKNGLTVLTPKLGETMVWGEETSRWWRDFA